ncbi:MAG: DNA methyltransferase [Candidatus Poribacteria bacterium]|nr:DNA methyltransferase [Candidatus Poribacteria bacterium]
MNASTTPDRYPPDANTLYYGDCLGWMREWEDNCVDLIYLDPPFNSNANYNVLFGTAGNGQAQYRAFNDTWHWDSEAEYRYARYEKATALRARKAIVGLFHIYGRSGMLAYITYMAERLEEMRRILKSTGSIYLHCDSYASHALKHLMDAIFGCANFRNEIVWCYTGPAAPRQRQFSRKHDTIFWYSMGKTWTFNVDSVRVPHKDGAPHLGGFGSGMDRSETQRYGRLGKIPETWWAETHGNGLTTASRQRNQYLGYPTQKPLALLERIIKASSNEGGIVLDPFCGCGTAVDAARRLNRRWMGIDISSFAIDLIKQRRLKDETIPVAGSPADLSSARKLAAEKPFDFESWAIMRLPGMAPNTKQVADGGVDGRGRLYDKPDDWDSDLALAQVKGGKRFVIDGLKAFASVANDAEAAIGCFITLDRVVGDDARSFAARQKEVTVRGKKYPRMNLWSIEDHFDDRPMQLPPMADPYTGKRIDETLF